MDTKVEKKLTSRILAIAFATAFCILVPTLILWGASNQYWSEVLLLQNAAWYVTFPITIVLLVIALKNNRRSLKWCCYCWLIVLYLSFPALLIGKEIALNHFTKSFEQGRQIAKLIEDYRSDFGKYPGSLEELKKLNEDIKLPISHYYYNAGGNEFSLRMVQPYYMREFVYNQQNDQWEQPFD